MGCMPASLHLFNGFLLISINGGGLDRQGILSSILPGFFRCSQSGNEPYSTIFHQIWLRAK
jgi:hypothetical protein